MRDTRDKIAGIEHGIRLRQMQQVVGSGSSLSMPMLVVLVGGSLFSVVTNYAVGKVYDILPLVAAVLIIQTILITIFIITERFDYLVTRAIVIMYFSLYAYIILALEPSLYTVFYAVLGFSPFAVMVLGSKEGVIWSVLILLIATGGFLDQGLKNNFSQFSLFELAFVACQTVLVTLFSYVIDIVAISYVREFVRQERATRNSQSQYESILDSIAEGLVAVDSKGVVRFVNSSTSKMLRLKPNQLIGTYIASSVMIFDKEENVVRNAEHPVNKVIHDKKSIVYDLLSDEKFYIMRGDKTRFLAGITISPVVVEGEVMGAVMLFRDLTEISVVEHSKSEFVSLASHQLRTPINAMSWYIEKMMRQRKGQLSEEQEHYVKEMASNNNRMLNLVSDLLNVSKIDLNQLEITKEDFSLLELIKTMIDKANRTINEREIAIDAKLPMVDITLRQSDKKMVGALIYNVLSNALKYSLDNDSVELRVNIVKKDVMLNELRNFKASDDGVLISVVDKGIGIPEQQNDKIFNKLYRGDNVQNINVDGTGLGLYVAKSFANELGGEIWFKSEEGKGSTFFIYLPIWGFKKN